MYVPHDYRETDQEFISAFIKTHSFATLITCDGGSPAASQLLFRLSREADGRMTLAAHMARVNPQWKTFEKSRDALVLFQGPHTYVSAAWYSTPSVPTWDYITVQARGTVQVVEDRTELYEMLTSLVNAQERESSADQGYRIESVPADLLEQMMNGIVGFKIAVTHTDCAVKLSQNRDDPDYARIMEKLKERGDEDSKAIAREMERRQPHRRDPNR